jgi:hypothetical protein
MLFKSLAFAATVTGVLAAGRPNTTSICDYYTTALFNGSNTAANQKTVLILVVNTAVIGNCKPTSQP